MRDTERPRFGLTGRPSHALDDNGHPEAGAGVRDARSQLALPAGRGRLSEEGNTPVGRYELLISGVLPQRRAHEGAERQDHLSFRTDVIERPLDCKAAPRPWPANWSSIWVCMSANRSPCIS